MPSGTSWLPLERIKEADAVLGDALVEGLRTVFARARKEKVPTVLDADLVPAKLAGILALTDYAVFSALRCVRARYTDDERPGVLSLVPGTPASRSGARATSGARPAEPRGTSPSPSASPIRPGRRCLPRRLRPDEAEGRPPPTARARRRSPRSSAHAWAPAACRPRRARRLSRPPACPRELGTRATLSLATAERPPSFCFGMKSAARACFLMGNRPRIERSEGSPLYVPSTLISGIIHSYLVSMLISV
jgi:hypothetical protein